MIRWVRSEYRAGELWSDLAWLAVVAAAVGGWLSTFL